MLSVAQDCRIRCLQEQLAAAEAMQRGTHREANVVASLTTPQKAGEKEQLDSADGEADAALRLELVSTKAALDDERQVICSCLVVKNMPDTGPLLSESVSVRNTRHQVRMRRLMDGQRLLQVHTEECQRLATEAAVARALASGAARSDLAAAAACAAEQAAREAMARSQRDAAMIYDQWRLRCVCCRSAHVTTAFNVTRHLNAHSHSIPLPCCLQDGGS